MENRVFSFIALLLISLSISSCNKDNNDNNNQTGQLGMVQAIIISGGNPVEISTMQVTISDLNHQGLWITGASVTVSGNVLTDTGDGSYSAITTLAPFSEGTLITVNIKCTAGDYTASGSMPAQGQSIQVPVSGAAEGSTLNIANNI